MDKIKNLILGCQMLFTAFGALVLVPILTGLDPNIAFLGAGIGTLVFQLVTKREVPVFLGSSFAFIPAMIYGIKTWGVPATLGGLFASGVVYLIFAGILKINGSKFLEKMLPPIVTGPIIMLIGLLLAPVAVNMAMGKTGDASIQLYPVLNSSIVAAITLFITAILSIWGKGFARLSSILIGLVTGYIAAIIFGMVNFEKFLAANWFSFPQITTPEFHLPAIIYIIPIALAPAIEHFGDIIAIGQVTGKDFLKNPGVHRTLLGDGLATMISTFLGGPPNTTYSEVTGAVALTKAHNPKIMTYAAIVAIAFGFISKLGALLASIPVCVIGGLLILLFGNIIVLGLGILINAQVDVHVPKNMLIIGVMLICGLGGMVIEAQGVAIKGVALASFLGVTLNLTIKKH